MFKAASETPCCASNEGETGQAGKRAVVADEQAVLALCSYQWRKNGGVCAFQHEIRQAHG